MRIVLASASPRRRELLTAAGIEVEVIPADVNESPLPNESPEDMVQRLAAAKADAVAPRVPGRLVLAADTVVCRGRHILGKPGSDLEARVMLRLLSGHTHTVFTGVCLKRLAPPCTSTWVAGTDVTFRELTEADIEDYLGRVSVHDKAGAYAIQEHGELLVAGTRGLRSNVIGLPVEEVCERLRLLGE